MGSVFTMYVYVQTVCSKNIFKNFWAGLLTPKQKQYVHMCTNANQLHNLLVRPKSILLIFSMESPKPIFCAVD